MTPMGEFSTKSPEALVAEYRTLASELIAYSRLREKVRLREDPSEYVEAERLIARFDALAARSAA